MTRTLRALLGLLGLFIGASALQHWLGGSELRQHYASTPLGAQGQFIIAAAQSAAAVFLLWPRYQVWAGFMLGGVLLLISGLGIARDGVHAAAWGTVALALIAIGAAALLRRTQRPFGP